MLKPGGVDGRVNVQRCPASQRQLIWVLFRKQFYNLRSSLVLILAHWSLLWFLGLVPSTTGLKRKSADVSFPEDKALGTDAAFRTPGSSENGSWQCVSRVDVFLHSGCFLSDRFTQLGSVYGVSTIFFIKPCEDTELPSFYFYLFTFLTFWSTCIVSYMLNFSSYWYESYSFISVKKHRVSFRAFLILRAWSTECVNYKTEASFKIIF